MLFLRFSCDQDPQRLQQILVHDVRRVEVGHPAQRIEHRAHRDDADDRSQAYLAAQKPADHRDRRPHNDVQSADGQFRKAFAQRD